MSETQTLVARGVHPAELTSVDRDDAIRIIRDALKKRSGKTWSVKGDRGTAWGWITITAPPKRRVAHIPNPDYHCEHAQPCHECPPAYFEGPANDRHGAWYMSETDRHELGELLGLSRPAHCQGVSIAAASDYRRFYIARALGLPDAGTSPQQYWD
jgi:hypothetical protein